jgi:Tfp pilus assembly protein PilF
VSLINKMLNDLEKRDAFLKENPDHVLDGLYSAYDIELTNSKKSKNIFLVILSLLLIICAFVLFHDKFDLDDMKFIVEETKVSEKSISTVVDVITEIKEVDNNVLNENEKIILESLKLDEELQIIAKPESIKKEKINYIDSIQFEKDEKGINLLIKMPNEINYLVYGLSNPSRTVVEVENVKLGFRLEDLKPVEPIVAIRYSISDEKRFKLVLESDTPLTIKKSTTSKSEYSHDLVVLMEYDSWSSQEIVTDEDAELVDIIDQQVLVEKENVFKGDIIKIPVNNSANAYVEKLYQQAFTDYKRGNISESLKKLNEVLNHDASHVKARSTLALVLSEKEHFDLAYSVLNEGLIQYPENVDWIKMYARLLLSEGKIVEARAMLEKQQPSLATNTEYYALHAAVLQKLADFEAAAKTYRNLLHINPHKAVWWLGLGISLESLKRYDDALYAYQKASSNGSIAQESRQFILQRINRLNNILKDEST